MRSTLAWAVLAVPFLALLAGAATFDPRSWPEPVGDEATYRMQAESLAYDLDLGYCAADYDRFVALHGRSPEGLILQSGDGGENLVYAKPLFYAAFLAPFVRLAPARGPAVANVLLLAATALVAAFVLRRSIGEAAPVLMAVFVFASVTFAHVFWVHADLFLMCCVALALALAYGGTLPERRQLTEIYQDPSDESGGRFLLRWAAVGVLLGAVALSRPFYAGLLLPAALAVPPQRRARGLTALAVGAGGLVALVVTANLAVRGTWTSYGGERQAFYGYTGYPEKGLEEGAWQGRVEERGPDSWIGEHALVFDFDPRQTAWNGLYFLAGRHVGVLPYFLPLVLGIWAYRRHGGRWALPLAVLVAALCFFYVRPFNFFGGGGALANRYFLPLYPAFWFLAARPLKAGRAVAAAAVVTALAAPYLWPLWTESRAFPMAPEGGLRHVSGLAREYLPYETTQSHLKPSGHDDVVQEGLWVKPLSPGLVPEAGGSRLRFEGDGKAAILVGSPRPLSTLWLEMASPGPARLDLWGGQAGEALLRPDGSSSFQLRLGSPRARHRMWWTEDDVYLYEIRFLPRSEDPPPAGGWVFSVRPGGFESP